MVIFAEPFTTPQRWSLKRTVFSFQILLQSDIGRSYQSTFTISKQSKTISRRSLSKSNITTQLYSTILLRLRNKYFPYNHEHCKIPSLQYCHASKLSYNFTIARFLPLFSYFARMPLHQFFKQINCGLCLQLCNLFSLDLS